MLIKIFATLKLLAWFPFLLQVYIVSRGIWEYFSSFPISYGILFGDADEWKGSWHVHLIGYLVQLVREDLHKQQISKISTTMWFLFFSLDGLNIVLAGSECLSAPSGFPKALMDTRPLGKMRYFIIFARGQQTWHDMCIPYSPGSTWRAEKSWTGIIIKVLSSFTNHGGPAARLSAHRQWNLWIPSWIFWFVLLAIKLLFRLSISRVCTKWQLFCWSLGFTDDERVPIDLALVLKKIFHKWVAT